jgi:hypothetical protein
MRDLYSLKTTHSNEIDLQESAMSEYAVNTINPLPDYEPTDGDLVPLMPEQIDRAMALSQRVADPEKRWPVYLNALALAGFEQWLQQHTTEISLDSSQSRILEPRTANSTTAVYHLQANGLRLCLVAIESAVDRDIAIPDIALDRQEFAAQLYIPISIYEELGQIRIHGFLRYDELIQHRQQQSLECSNSGSYWMPTAWFNPDLERLLLYLSCLDSTAIPLPQATPIAPIVPIQQLMIQPVINAGVWLQQQLDHALDSTAESIAAPLNWLFLPPITLASAVRDTLTNLNTGADPQTEEFTRILTSLVRTGMYLPENNRTAYQDIQLADQALRLYITIAPLPESDEWSLLAILKPQTEQQLSAGTLLQISDGIAVVTEQAIAPASSADYLYTSAIGNLDEQFIITIAAADGHSFTLPPFAFEITE